MQVFARRGFQLRSASFETRIAYTGFLALMIPGAVSLLALSAGRIGFTPGAIAAYYRGGEAEMSFPRQFWQLVEVSHFHLFSIPIVLLILAHLLGSTPVPARARLTLTTAAFGGAALDLVGPWAVRYLAAGFAYLLLAGWLLLAGGMLTMTLLSLLGMWGPEQWTSWRSRSPASSAGAMGAGGQ